MTILTDTLVGKRYYLWNELTHWSTNKYDL